MVMSNTPFPVGAPDLSLPSAKHVLEAVAQVTRIPAHDIISKRLRPGQVGTFHERAKARRLVAYVSRKLSNRSWTLIAKHLHRDHTTVISAYHMADALVRRNDAETVSQVAKVSSLAVEIHRAERKRGVVSVMSTPQETALGAGS
jgi:chromosomal replication initiation ATPase DnaA